MRSKTKVRFIISLCFNGIVLAAVAQQAVAQCQNQLEIDVCKAGCTATSDVCGALCGAAVDVCTGACIGGCALSCTIDCCAGFCPDSSACRSCIGNCEDDCAAGCQLDCDDCIFQCERDCQSICRPYRKIGEYCAPLVDRCADGLTCWWFPMPGESQPQCFPTENDALFSEDFCRSMHVPSIHNTVINDGTALSFGTGAASAVGVGTSLETGVIYGEEGSFGCYFSNCIGGIVDVEVGIYASVGAFGAGYGGFQGEALMFVEEAGSGIAFAFAQYVTHNFEFLGVADILSIEASLAPITVGVFDCFTIVDTVGMWDPATQSLSPVSNSPPVARCLDRQACAESDSCTADVSIDNGSVDPDGQSLVVIQSPPGPYGIGEHQVALTVTDSAGESDQCTAVVTVDDCTPPEIESVSASPEILWPPNHQMHEVQVVASAADGCDATVACRIVTVTSNEAHPGQGSPHSGSDFEIIDATTVLLRAQRRGNGDGRTYLIEVLCEDSSGNATASSTRVVVPHDLGDIGSERGKHNARSSPLR